MYSADFQWQVVRCMWVTKSYIKTSWKLDLNFRTVKSIWQYYLAHGVVREAPCERLHLIEEDDLKWFLKYVHENPEAYLDEYLEAFVEHRNLWVSIPTLMRALQQLNISHKKLHARSQEARLKDKARFINEISQYDINQLVFCDEVFSDNRTSNRRYGWSLRGTQAIGKATYTRGLRISTMGVMCKDGVLDSYSIEGSFSPHMIDFAENCLFHVMNPFPGPRSVLVFDNLNTHKNPAFIKLLETHGIRIVFLPAYSPQYNPIECVYSKVKRYIRRNGNSLLAAGLTHYSIILYAFSSITPEDCEGFMRQCGFF